ncbi:MAG: enoyl-CoA hydratase/isomerase family protein, partial [Salinirussus sp.]
HSEVMGIPDDIGILTIGPDQNPDTGLTAGLHLDTVRDMGTSEAREMLETLNATMTALRDGPAVTICCCGEYALGGGLEIAMSCDFRIARDGAALGLPEIDAGLVTGLQGGLLVRLVGLQAAKELIYTGESVSGTEAEELGLVNRAAPADEYVDAIDELVGTLAAKSPVILRRQREVFKALRCNGIEAGIDHSMETIATCFDTHDQAEAMTAFLEDREPVFQGR